MLDFHSHYPSGNSIVCTDSPETVYSNHNGRTLMNCIGLLPEKWTEEREQLLYNRLSSEKDLQMGEIGLDRRFQDRLPMEYQIRILKRELGFAVDNDRSVSLHCVRATGPMLEILSGLSFRPFSILWHGFTGSAETAASLYRLGVIVSVGPRFTGDIEKIFSANPMTVLETDYTGNEEQKHLEILEEMYRRAQMSAAGCADALKIFSNN